MQIHFERSGGLLGRIEKAQIDTDSLSAEEAEEIEKIVNQANFFTLPEAIINPRGADQFTYKLMIDNSEQQHSIKVGDSVIPENLQPLVQKLTRIARKQ
jgi:hypothetical protein